MFVSVVNSGLDEFIKINTPKIFIITTILYFFIYLEEIVSENKVSPSLN